MDTYTFTVKPYVAQGFPHERYKGIAKNRIGGNWLGRQPDVSDVELVTIVKHPDGSADITYRLIE
jgi:hypothetical protein